MTNPERAVLAGGCFWGMQDLIRRLPGVLSTRVGYTGGDVAHATYRNHGNHAEGIEIRFDPDRLSYRRLLEYFFQIHNPTTRNRQGNDIGSSYRSAIYYIDERQRQIAEARGTLVVAPESMIPFTRAEIDLVAWMREDRAPARLNLQLHKVIWGAEVRGV